MAASQIDWAEDLVTEVVGERLKAATRKRGAEPLSHAIEAKKLRESWEALRVWLRAKLLAKRGASIPGFGRFTWQVLGDYRPSDLQDRPEELIPLRPVFQFSEDFCKAHLLPWRPIAEDKLVECADLNYSILALRHTSRLTKDMVWSALRDLQRKIGDRIASGYSLTLDFGVGQLVSDRGKPRFLFDASKLRREEETVVPQSAPVSEEEEEPTPVVEATQTPQVDETEPTASELATTNALLARDGTEAFLAMMPPKVMTKDPRVKVDRDRTPARPEASKLSQAATRLLRCDSSVEQDQYARHLATIEKDADKLQKEQVKFQKLLAEGFRADAVKKVHWREANLTMQRHLKEQIAAQKAALEAEAEQAAIDNEVIDQLVERTKRGENVDRSAAEALGMEYRPALTCSLKQHSITGFPTRGRETTCTQKELLTYQLDHVNLRADLAKEEREKSLEEERRFLDHVAREQQMAAIEREQRKAATTEELLRSWETAEHVNNITRLKEMGADAMLSYARDAIPSDDVLRRAPALPPTRQLAATINAARTAGLEDMKLGFSPTSRGDPRGSTPAVDV